MMTKIVWDAAYPGDVWGFLTCFAAVASGGTGRVAGFRHRDAAGELVHTAGLLQDAVVHLAGRTEDHTLRFCQTRTVRRAPRDICSYG